VIHQNEVRKAKKLAELTHKLELEPVEDDTTVDAAERVPVPLCLVMPMNQLTTHGFASPPPTAASAHEEQSPAPSGDTSGNTIVTSNEPASESEHVNSHTVGCETAMVPSPPPTADGTEAAVDNASSNTADSNTAAADGVIIQ